MRSRAFLAVLVTLTLTGCLRTDVALVVNDDESGTFDVEMLIDRSRMEQLAEMFGEADEDLEDPCAGIRDDLPWSRASCPGLSADDIALGRPTRA